jgi:GTP cyclohydrolase IA
MLDSTLEGVLSAPALEPRCTRAEAEAAVRTLIRWAGEDPDREGLRDTPQRVARAYREWFAGYQASAGEILARSFGETAGYDDLVVVRDIPVSSTCEHHLAAIRGVAHVAYLPGPRVIGLSKLARVTEVFARRMQVQERLTSQIAQAILHQGHARGAAVFITATHDCMNSRGARTHGASTVTRAIVGACQHEPWRADLARLLV